MPFGIGGPLAVLQSRGLAPSRDGALEFGVEPDAPQGRALPAQPLPFLPAGAVQGGVVGGLGGPGGSEPDLLCGVHPPLCGNLARVGHALAGEGQDLERVVLGSGRDSLGDEPLLDPAATIGMQRHCRVSANAFSSPDGSSWPTVANAWYSSQMNTAGRM